MIPYVYIVVRTDIKSEYQLVQACHSALEAGDMFTQPSRAAVHLVVLSVESEDELRIVSEKLYIQDIKHRMFYESWSNTGFTSLTTEPIKKQIEGILRSLPLFCYGENI